MAQQQVYDGGPDGLTIGRNTSALVSFYGAPGVAQAGAITSPDTTASTSTTNAFGYATSTQADAIVTALRAVLVALRNLGAIAT